ncbi:hypothetical protein MBLNU457_5729t1 [Dothideomycetes sp. NU457]
MATIAGKKIGPIGYGLMGLTWRPQPPPTEQAFEAMNTALAHGATFWNGGEFYGPPERNSQVLLEEYFSKYPENAEKIIYSVKGGINLQNLHPEGSSEGVRRSVDNVIAGLKGKKFLDVFECARVDPKTPIEVTIAAIAEYVKEGKLGGISLSECSADTIRRASKVHKIEFVEVEFSMWATEILDNDVAKTCAELNIPIVAYSPLGRGFLTGQIKSLDDIPDGDFRKHLPRLQPDVFPKNIELVHSVEKIAEKKGCKPAQLAVSWILEMAKKSGMPTIIPIPGAGSAERVKENMTLVDMSKDDMAEIDKILASFPQTGARYGGPQEKLMFGDSPPLHTTPGSA